MHEVFEKAIGSTQNMITPLESRTEEVIKAKREKLERWAERYFELYAKDSNTSHNSLDIAEHLPSWMNWTLRHLLKKLEEP